MKTIWGRSVAVARADVDPSALAALGEGHVAYVRAMRSEEVKRLFPEAPDHDAPSSQRRQDGTGRESPEAAGRYDEDDMGTVSRFLLADGMEVLGADLSNGLLSIDLARPEPERIVRGR
jgi:hypothetical protein